MKLQLLRKWATDKSTIGELHLDGKFECYTLEDVVRRGPKVAGQTAIPAGNYRIILDMSQRFGRVMPHILNVPGFEGVRIHAGNTAADTEGCLLVGQTRTADAIGQSKMAYETLFRKLQGAADEITIEIKDL